MSIATIRHSVEVKASPARAFDLFTTHMGQWWPKGRTVGANPHAAILVEPQAAGRWFERDEVGNETQWGKVLACEPPNRLLLGWQLNRQFTYDPELLTEVELSFEALAGGGTRVTLEHRDLERFGEQADAHIAKLNGGWPTQLGNFSEYATSHP